MAKAAKKGDEVSELIVQTFRKFDANGDGLISKDELTTIFKTLSGSKFDAKDVDSLMAAADLNKDGKIQYKEFVNWVMADKEKKSKQAAAGTASTDALDKRGGVKLDFRTFLPERFKVDINARYAMDKLTIGEGGYGKVFVARDKGCDDRIVAVKKVTKTNDRDGEAVSALQNEIELMKELDHPNICKLLGTFEQERDMYFIMELCEGGELFDRIIQMGHVDEKLTSNIVRQVSSGLFYAHGRGIAHRDIKPENVVFCSKDIKDTTIKLIDWGLAMSFLGKPMTSAVGSFTYAAPEVIMSQNVKAYTQACDLWSLGVLTYVMLSGKPPFWGSQHQHLRNAQAEKYPMSGAPWDRMKDEAKSFVKALLKANPSKRMTIEQVCAHPFLTKSVEGSAPVEQTQTVLKNLKSFGNASSFSKMCITAVARQLGHTHLKDIHSVFRELDANGDGTLSMEEVSMGLATMFGEGSPEYQEAKQLYEGMDLDGSHAIDYTEFCAAGLSQKETSSDSIIWGAFKAFDLDNSGFLELRDIQQILDHADVQDVFSSDVCKQCAEEILDKFDRDKDKKISFDDWKQLMSKAWEQDEGMPTSPTAKNGSLRSLGAYDLLSQVNQLSLKS
jgi:calcium-dependent protein kinase